MTKSNGIGPDVRMSPQNMAMFRRAEARQKMESDVRAAIEKWLILISTKGVTRTDALRSIPQLIGRLKRTVRTYYHEAS